MRDVVATKQHNYDHMKRSSTNIEASEDLNKAKSGWISWEKFKGIEGEAKALLLVTHRKIDTQADARCVGLGLEWPDNLMVWSSEQKRHVSSGTRDETTFESAPEDLDAETAKEMMSSVTSGSGLSLQPSASPSAGLVAIAAPLAPPLLEAKAQADDAAKEQLKKDVQVALTSVRTTHSTWDRRGREYNSTLKNSEKCKATKGSHFENELRKIVEACVVTDSKLLKAEIDLQQDIGDQQLRAIIGEAAELCGVLVAEIKKANKKRQSLNSWINVADDEDDE